MTDGNKCRNCGSLSTDPEWCDICGADLAAQVNGNAWLEVGDEITLSVTPVAAEPSEFMAIAGDDTMPPMDTTSQDWTGNARGDVQDDRPIVTRTLGGVTLHTPPSVVPHDGSPYDVVLRLEEAVSQLSHKRVFRALGSDGNAYRVEERSTPSPEPVPDGIRSLTWLVDVPLGATMHGTHEIKAYRHVEGQTLHERMQARDEAMTPSEIVEWMRPVLTAIQSIHAAGFLCLRLCPYTIKITQHGRVFLQGVEVLYPMNAALEKLPAIAGYTAPEVYAASVGEPPNHTADLYMAGMVVYYLIAGVDPPASMYTGYTPAILARDFAPEFPLGFAPVLGVLGAVHPDDRPQSTHAFRAELDTARERSVRQVAGFDAVTLGVAADTHVGIVKRVLSPVNQDAVFYGIDALGTTSLILVADGVSTASYGSGDLASNIARRVVVDAWRTLIEQPRVMHERGPNSWLNDLMQRINQEVVNAVNADHAPFSGEPSEVMGSTCMIALIQNGLAHLVSLGDSRAYLVRNGYMEQINRDHNLLTLGITEGLDPDVAIGLPQGDALARCLGAFDLDNGTLVSVPVEPDAYTFPMQPGDRLLLATDGLTDYAGDTISQAEAAIYDVIMRGDLPDLMCVDLLALANAGGGGDNIGVAVAIADPRFANPHEWFTHMREMADQAHASSN